MTLEITEKKSPMGTILILGAVGIGAYFLYSIFFKKSSASATDMADLLAKLMGSGAATPSAPSLQYDSNTSGSNISPYGISYPGLSAGEIQALAVPPFFSGDYVSAPGVGGETREAIASETSDLINPANSPYINERGGYLRGDRESLSKATAKASSPEEIPFNSPWQMQDTPTPSGTSNVGVVDVIGPEGVKFNTPAVRRIQW
jgi:hypothetical protein